MTIKTSMIILILFFTISSSQLLATDKRANSKGYKITGSHLRIKNKEKRKDITIVTREQIEMSGMQTISDLLRTSTINSFGSYNERSGSSGGQAALINMRGLGTSRNIILINGRRLPGSALFGTSATNLNAIPLVTIERIEILTDGASSIYGADAVAGVINIVLRDDFVGAEMELGVVRPKNDGGNQEYGSFMVGTQSGKGSMVFATEFFRKDAVFNRGREYSAVQILQEGGVIGVDTIGVSAFGNTGFTTDFGSAFVVGSCQTTNQGGSFAGIFTNPFGVPGEACGFGDADYSTMTGAINRFNTLISADYEINESHTLYLQNSLAKIQSFGRSSPVSGFLFIPESAPLNDTGSDLFLAHRFIAHGPRQEDYVEFDLDSIIGLYGEIWNNSIKYDASFRSYTSTIENLGNGYLNQPAIEAAIIDGSYNYINPFANNAQTLAAVGYTVSRDLRVR